MTNSRADTITDFLSRYIIKVIEDGYGEYHVTRIDSGRIDFVIYENTILKFEVYACNNSNISTITESFTDAIVWMAKTEDSL